MFMKKVYVTVILFLTSIIFVNARYHTTFLYKDFDFFTWTPKNQISIESLNESSDYFAITYNRDSIVEIRYSHYLLKNIGDSTFELSSYYDVETDCDCSPLIKIKNNRLIRSSGNFESGFNRDYFLEYDVMLDEGQAYDSISNSGTLMTDVFTGFKTISLIQEHYVDLSYSVNQMSFYNSYPISKKVKKKVLKELTRNSNAWLKVNFVSYDFSVRDKYEYFLSNGTIRENFKLHYFGTSTYEQHSFESLRGEYYVVPQRNSKIQLLDSLSNLAQGKVLLTNQKLFTCLDNIDSLGFNSHLRSKECNFLFNDKEYMLNLEQSLDEYANFLKSIDSSFSTINLTPNSQEDPFLAKSNLNQSWIELSFDGQTPGIALVAYLLILENKLKNLRIEAYSKLRD